MEMCVLFGQHTVHGITHKSLNINPSVPMSRFDSLGKFYVFLLVCETQIIKQIIVCENVSLMKHK